MRLKLLIALRTLVNFDFSRSFSSGHEAGVSGSSLSQSQQQQGGRNDEILSVTESTDWVQESRETPSKKFPLT